MLWRQKVEDLKEGICVCYLKNLEQNTNLTIWRHKNDVQIAQDCHRSSVDFKNFQRFLEWTGMHVKISQGSEETRGLRGVKIQKMKRTEKSSSWTSQSRSLASHWSGASPTGRYSSPLQWSIGTKNSLSQKVMIFPDGRFLRFLARW